MSRVTVPVDPGISNDATAAPRLGELLVAEGLLTPTQLQEALRIQRASDNCPPLGHILIAQKVVTHDQLLSVLEQHRRSSKLGDILLKDREINRAQLKTALREQHRTQRPLGEVLLELGYISEERLRLALCRQLHIRFYNLDSVTLDPTVRDLVSETFATKHRIVPVSRIGTLLILAMDDPTQSRVIDDVAATVGLRIEVVTSTSDAITRALQRLYRSEVEPSLAAGPTADVIGEGVDRDVPTAPREGPSDSADGIVWQLLRFAIDRRATDIHLEAIKNHLQVRFRIDGVLQQFDLGALGRNLARLRVEAISRIKILASLDIAERRRPQDGSFRAQVESDGQIVPVDFRVSLMPSYHGENAVIQVLDPRGAPDSLAALNMTAPLTDRLQRLIRSSAGTILVTGPTGSGKSTTLFAILKSLYRPEIKIVTAEDPIEYVYPQFCQHQVDERVGNTFAAYMRSFLRHDPEVVMLGEIRDAETAMLAFRAAQTGHLVLSTLHTSHALGAVTWFKDLGIEGSVWAPSLLGVLAQRLVREVCGDCKEEYTPTPGVLEAMFEVIPRDLQWYHGVGCATCHHTGYRRRIAIAELWVPGDDEIELIGQQAPRDVIEAAARKNTYSLATDAMARLREGRTTVDEVLRALPPSALRELHSAATDRRSSSSSSAF